MWLRTEVRRCELGFPYALTPESAEGLTKEEICSATTKSASPLTIPGVKTPPYHIVSLRMRIPAHREKSRVRRFPRLTTPECVEAPSDAGNREPEHPQGFDVTGIFRAPSGGEQRRSFSQGIVKNHYRGVAQPGSALAWGARGQQFESARPDQFPLHLPSTAQGGSCPFVPHAPGGTGRTMGPAGRPLILVSNDDGIRSAGLRALVDSLESVGEVVVVAPDRERSATGHSLTLTRPLRVTTVDPRLV